MVTYDAVMPSTNSTKIFYLVREETTYTYDREDDHEYYFSRPSRFDLFEIIERASNLFFC